MNKLKKVNKEWNIDLIFLSIICILNIIAVILKITSIRYIFLISILVVAIFCKKESMVPIVLFIHPNSGLFDDVEFKYLFNFIITIMAVKSIIFFGRKMPKKTLLLFLTLILYEVFLCLFSGEISKAIVSLGSWAASYIIFIILSYNCKNLDFKKSYKYFFIGFCFSFACGIITPILRWGINIPTAYRFVGLLRDPNYYCIDALLLIFSANTYATLTKKNKMIFIIPILIMGIFSVSKTFILLLAIGIMINKIVNIRKINIKKSIAIILVSIVAILIAYKQGFIDLIVNKYLYRTETTSLFTGRDYLWSFYVSSIFDSMKNLLFGNSLTYYSVILNPGVENTFFNTFIAHNTYLDVIISWGIIGTILYIFFLKSILDDFKKNYSEKVKVKNKDYICCGLVYLVSLMSLSYLGADAFAIILLYLTMLKYSFYHEKDENEYRELV